MNNEKNCPVHGKSDCRCAYCRPHSDTCEELQQVTWDTLRKGDALALIGATFLAVVFGSITYHFEHYWHRHDKVWVTQTLGTTVLMHRQVTQEEAERMIQWAHNEENPDDAAILSWKNPDSLQENPKAFTFDFSKLTNK